MYAQLVLQHIRSGVKNAKNHRYKPQAGALLSLCQHFRYTVCVRPLKAVHLPPHTIFILTAALRHLASPKHKYGW